MQLPADFLRVCSRNGLNLSEHTARSLGRYVELLLEWNQKINLISRRDQENVWIAHILHCISPWFKLEPKSNWRILDLGTGGGLPGIPLAILRPDLHIVLLDSIKKKTKAVAAIVSELGLANAEVVTGRAEDTSGAAQFKNSFDMVIARAVAALPDLARWALGFLRLGTDSGSLDTRQRGRLLLPDGVLVALKGGDLDMEMRQARLRLKKIDRINVIPLVFDGSDRLGLEDKSAVVVAFR